MVTMATSLTKTEASIKQYVFYLFGTTPKLTSKILSGWLRNNVDFDKLSVKFWIIRKSGSDCVEIIIS